MLYKELHSPSGIWPVKEKDGPIIKKLLGQYSFHSYSTNHPPESEPLRKRTSGWLQVASRPPRRKHIWCWALGLWPGTPLCHYSPQTGTPHCQCLEKVHNAVRQKKRKRRKFCPFFKLASCKSLQKLQLILLSSSRHPPGLTVKAVLPLFMHTERWKEISVYISDHEHRRRKQQIPP